MNRKVLIQFGYIIISPENPDTQNIAVVNLKPENVGLGPVVQSIVSLTTSLRLQLVKYMQTRVTNMLLFFVGKM